MLANMFFVVVKRNQITGMYGVPKCSIQFQLVSWNILQNSLVQQVAFCFHRDKPGEEKTEKEAASGCKENNQQGLLVLVSCL